MVEFKRGTTYPSPSTICFSLYHLNRRFQKVLKKFNCKGIMRILLNDYAGYPFIVNFASEMAKRGHIVKFTYAGYNTTPKGDFDSPEENPTLHRTPLFTKSTLKKDKFVKRLFQEREFGYLVSRVAEQFHPDVIISADTPLDAQAILLQTAHNYGIPFIFWLQDFIGIATKIILSKKLPGLGSWIGYYYIMLEKRILRDCDHIIAITQDFVPLLQKWGVPAEKISVIPNWAPLDALPVHPKNNRWARQHALDEKFCFMYTGSLGMKHDPNLLLILAEKYRNERNVKVVVLSEGPGVEWLQQKITSKVLENLTIMSYQPFVVMPEVMGAADVLIAILDADAGVFSVPSKVLSYLCAQRPILASISPENLAAKIIQQYSAGFVVSPGDENAFLDNADLLLKDASIRNLCGRNSRAYAETHFKIQNIANQFESIMNNLIPL